MALSLRAIATARSGSSASSSSTASASASRVMRRVPSRALISVTRSQSIGSSRATPAMSPIHRRMPPLVLRPVDGEVHQRRLIRERLHVRPAEWHEMRIGPPEDIGHAEPELLLDDPPVQLHGDPARPGERVVVLHVAVRGFLSRRERRHPGIARRRERRERAVDVRLVDEQVEIGLRPERDVAIRPRRERRPLEREHRDARRLEDARQRDEFPGDAKPRQRRHLAPQARLARDLRRHGDRMRHGDPPVEQGEQAVGRGLLEERGPVGYGGCSRRQAGGGCAGVGEGEEGRTGLRCQLSGSEQ